MSREDRPYRTHQRFHRQHRDRDHQGHRQERHPDEENRNHQHPERHRHPDEENRNLRLLGDQRRRDHQDDLDHRHQPDDQRHQDHQDDSGHRHQPDDLRLGDPCPAKEQMGCYPDEQQDEECPCPEPKRMDCYQGAECPGLRSVRRRQKLALRMHRPLVWLRLAQLERKPLELPERLLEQQALLPQQVLQVLQERRPLEPPLVFLPLA